MPRVSYVSLLDIWMLVCMIFVFSCILEFIIITIYLRSGKKLVGEKVGFCSQSGFQSAKSMTTVNAVTKGSKFLTSF